VAFLVVRDGKTSYHETLEAALEAAGRDGLVITCHRGTPVVLRVEAGVPGEPPIPETVVIRLSPAGKSGEATAGLDEGPRAGASRVAAVFDQMFRGFAEIVGRYVGGVELHQVVGRGLQRPVRRGRVTLWPAHDDYDVLKIVESLAGEGRRVVFFTGDKRLARQAEALANPNIIVRYMPPNEYPGKEAIAEAMIEAVREALG